MWVKYGKTYGDLCHELKAAGESIVGVQVDVVPSEKPVALWAEGLYLIGDIDAAGDLSGEE